MTIKIAELRKYTGASDAGETLLSHPIADSGFLDNMSRRGSLFKSAGTNLNLKIESGLTFDFGSRDPTGSMVASLLSEDNDVLRDYLESNAMFHRGKDDLVAWFVTCKVFDRGLSRHFRVPVFQCRDRVLVLVHSARSAAVYVLDPKGMETVYYTNDLNRTSERHSTLPHSLTVDDRLYGLHTHVPVHGKTGWKAAKYRAERLLPSRSGGYIELGEFTAISEHTLVSARLVAFSLNGLAPRLARPEVSGFGSDPTMPANPADSTSLSYCIDTCSGGAILGVAASIKFGAGCSVGTLGSAFALCWIGAAAWGLSAVGAGWLCSQACQREFGPQPSDASGDPSASNSGVDGYGDVGDEGGGDGGDGHFVPLPIEMGKDPYA
jgi:hypothetical protein